MHNKGEYGSREQKNKWQKGFYVLAYFVHVSLFDTAKVIQLC